MMSHEADLSIDEKTHLSSKRSVSRPGNHPSKKMKKKHTDPAVVELRSIVQQSCKTNDLMRAIEAYEQAIENNTHIEAQSFYNLLSLCDGIERSIHVGTPKNSPDDNSDSKSEVRRVDVETRQRYAFQIKQHMDQLSIPLTETAYTALIKLLCKAQPAKAQEMLEEAEAVQQCKPKLRMYAPLLIAYCERGEMMLALKIWHRLSKQELVLGEREYAALIRCATTTGNSRVMERVLSDLAEDVLVPSRETCLAITDWFKSAAACAYGTVSPSDSETKLLLQDIKVEQSGTTPSMGPVQTKNKNGWGISNACLVDTATGVLQTGCLQGASLQPATISKQTWDEMKTLNATIVTSGKLQEDDSQFQGGRKGPKKMVADHVLRERRRHWTAFQDYLSRRCQKGRLDYVIDGANVGYFEQNFAGAPKHVDYNQIDWVVRHLLRNDKNILLVMHARHFAPHMLPRQFEPIVKSWLDRGLLYKTPRSMNDDWFWLQASLVSGPGTLVLTNDEMRDHHFQMLAPRSFLRWKERHQVHFAFGSWEKDEHGKSLGRRVELTFPDIYSRRIQRVCDGLVIPLPKRGDENRFLDGSYVADQDEPTEETYICIRPEA